ncbi:protein-export membrane protein SecF [Solemya pervernicosa gill symbiont]|uniref:Protein-export membrane protein SecF n=2 Tax=Gammaproteobacteria incertae sedis TaxID=118884 RepID=A0A1T2LAP9_9GAMM|nr:protein-export membrane protein SecF [Solemya pervernicosa gill symbiont]
MSMAKKPFAIDFMSKRKFAVVISATLILVAIFSLATRGLNFGIDFTGGTLIEVAYPESVDLKSVRSTLAEAGFKDATAQHFGTSKDLLIRIAASDTEGSSEISNRVLERLDKEAGVKLDMRRVEFVGPQVGDELTEQGGLAMLFALIGILIYVALRFEYRFAFGSVFALVHDVMITLGIFSLLGIEFDLTVLAAILAVIGYSLNDTIVVFDRVRENFRRIRKGEPVDVVNTSINETLARTLMTSLTTMLVLLALFFLGGEVIHSFALALIIGVVVGTYSSIYIASASVLMLGVSKEDLMQVKKEGVELDDLP